MRSVLSLIGLLGGFTLVVTACATGLELAGDDDDETSDDGEGGSGSTGSMTTSTGTKGSPCGNGAIDGLEACDGANLAGKTCESLQYAGGTLACDEMCKLDTSGCVETMCDNGKIEEGEECDGTDLDGATCATSGFAGGELACTPEACTLDTSDCKAALEDGFEGGTLPTGFVSTGWTVSSGVAYAGSYALRSGPIGNNGTTSVSVTVKVDTSGSISFYHQESTEANYDYLRFYIDGSLQGTWSGITGWQLASYQLSAGTHQLQWVYTKDGSQISGLDAVFVDELVATGAYIP